MSYSALDRPLSYPRYRWWVRRRYVATTYFRRADYRSMGDHSSCLDAHSWGGHSADGPDPTQPGPPHGSVWRYGRPHRGNVPLVAHCGRRGGEDLDRPTPSAVDGREGWFRGDG